MVSAVLYLALLLASTVSSVEGGFSALETEFGQRVFCLDQSNGDKDSNVDDPDEGRSEGEVTSFRKQESQADFEYPAYAIGLKQAKHRAIRAPPVFLI